MTPLPSHGSALNRRVVNFSDPLNARNAVPFKQEAKDQLRKGRQCSQCHKVFAEAREDHLDGMYLPIGW